MANQAEHQQPAPKKPRLVFTDLQRRTLQAIFKTHAYLFQLTGTNSGQIAASPERIK
ncbi:Homeobox protein onecut [Acromyrmex echinatior]|uniref:Homeobox protein onecut n=1 Tax=Acromyrmex echinatior TaxID=103372 RepID=F4W6T7_ACREC|nr:Homeobox protein onecut [Acromyrmex echinatior]